MGIPQGEVFSVTLFIVTINSILGELGNGLDGSLFADDLEIYITIRNQRVATKVLQGVTDKLDVWTALRGLTFSPNKTVSMTFRKRNEEPIEIMLRNKIVPSKESTQFLRMTLDIRLNWQEHKQIKSQSKESSKYYKSGSRKEMGRRSENHKKLYSAICRKNRLWLPRIQYSFCRKIKETRQYTQ